jgi:hypothetical protein
VPALLRGERRSATLLFLLHYLIAVADRLGDTLKADIIAAIEAVLSTERLGDDFVLHGAGPTLPASDDTRSMRWGLELAAGYLLELIGGPGQAILERYRHDHRGYARVAAGRLSARLSQRKGEV